MTRDDVAEVLAELLARPGPATAGLVLVLVGGDTPIAEAVDAVKAG